MYLICICKLFPPSFLLPSISYKSNVALQQRHLWSTKRVYPNDEMNIVGKFSLSASRDHPPPKKNYFVNFPAWEKFHTLLENSQNAKTNSVACLCITLSFGWNLQFSPVRYFARGYPIRLPEVTFGISRARAISLEHKNTMFKYIKTLKCGQTKNIYFTKHDIYFTKLMLILQNINLELKSALRTKYIFYRFLLYMGVVIVLNSPY